MLNSAFKIPLPAIALYIGVAALFGGEGIGQQKSYKIMRLVGGLDVPGEMRSVNLKLRKLLRKTVNYNTKARQINHTSI